MSRRLGIFKATSPYALEFLQQEERVFRTKYQELGNHKAIVVTCFSLCVCATTIFLNGFMCNDSRVFLHFYDLFWYTACGYVAVYPFYGLYSNLLSTLHQPLAKVNNTVFESLHHNRFIFIATTYTMWLIEKKVWLVFWIGVLSLVLSFTEEDLLNLWVLFTCLPLPWVVYLQFRLKESFVQVNRDTYEDIEQVIEHAHEFSLNDAERQQLYDLHRQNVEERLKEPRFEPVRGPALVITWVATTAYWMYSRWGRGLTTVRDLYHITDEETFTYQVGMLVASAVGIVSVHFYTYRGSSGCRRTEAFGFDVEWVYMYVALWLPSSFVWFGVFEYVSRNTSEDLLSVLWGFILLLLRDMLMTLFHRNMSSEYVFGRFWFPNQSLRYLVWYSLFSSSETLSLKSVVILLLLSVHFVLQRTLIYYQVLPDGWRRWWNDSVMVWCHRMWRVEELTWSEADRHMFDRFQAVLKFIHATRLTHQEIFADLLSLITIPTTYVLLNTIWSEECNNRFIQIESWYNFLVLFALRLVIFWVITQLFQRQLERNQRRLQSESVRNPNGEVSLDTLGWSSYERRNIRTYIRFWFKKHNLSVSRIPLFTSLFMNDFRVISSDFTNQDLSSELFMSEHALVSLSFYIAVYIVHTSLLYNTTE